ncbi:MAG: hypothetical protein ABI769_18065 [Pseudomonadota bacterium]
MRESTSVLLLLVAFLATKAYPEYGWWPYLAPAIYFGAHFHHWWTVTRPEKRREKEEQRLNDIEYWEYKRKHDAIRDKYDPEGEWNEGTSVPWAFTKEIQELNEEYHDVIVRRFGPEWDEDDDD